MSPKTIKHDQTFLLFQLSSTHDESTEGSKAWSTGSRCSLAVVSGSHWFDMPSDAEWLWFCVYSLPFPEQFTFTCCCNLARWTIWIEFARLPQLDSWLVKNICKIAKHQLSWHYQHSCCLFTKMGFTGEGKKSEHCKTHGFALKPLRPNWDGSRDRDRVLPPQMLRPSKFMLVFDKSCYNIAALKQDL